MSRLKLRFLAAFILVLVPLVSLAQTVIATVPVGMGPTAIAVNPVTNKIYVVDQTANSLTVIDGATDSTQTFAVGSNPTAVAVNSVTNKIYVSVSSPASVVVIDGDTLATSSVPVPAGPGPLAINSVSNKIYVTTFYSTSNVLTEIDGTTLATRSLGVNGAAGIPVVNQVTDKIYLAVGTVALAIVDGPSLAYQTVISVPSANPTALAVNSVTNKIYLGSATNVVTVIDGSTLLAQQVAVGQQPTAVVVNPATNLIYVANSGDTSVTVINGTSLATATVPVTLNPTALAINQASNTIYAASNHVQAGHSIVTVISGFNDSTVDVQVGNFAAAVVANPNTDRTYVTNTNDNTVSVIGGAALRFVAVTPCRAFDTRKTTPIQGGTSRDFIIAGTCDIPPTAAAYSLNIGVVPQGPLGFLTAWPTGGDRPLVSTLNSTDGRIKANAAIVPAGAGEAVSVYVTDTTNVFLDVNGYFVADSSQLAFYPLTPCRVVDTRRGNGGIMQSGETRDFALLAGPCNIPSTAQAYSLNFTVVPPGRLGYLSTWPAGKTQPLVSTLNDTTGTIVANAAIVPAGTGGDIDVYVQDATQVVIDINGYFAPPDTGGLSLYTVAPCRVLDTRKGNGAFNGLLVPPVNVVASPCGVLSTAQGFVLNATVVPPGPLGYLTLWPDGEQQPVVSTLNAFDGYITNNMAIVPTVNGSIDAFADGTTQLILDLFGYFAP